MSLDVEWIEDPRRWQEVRAAWDGVVLASSVPSIYATWDFLDASFRHYAAPLGNRLAALIVWEGTRAVGTAAWQVAPRRPPVFGLRRMTVLARWEADRPAPAFCAGREADCAGAVLEGLVAHDDEWDVLDWVWAPAEHPFTAGLRDWAQQSRDRRLMEEEQPPSALVELPASWEEYTGRLRYRKELQRLRRRLEQRGRWEHEVYEEAEEMSGALDLYLAVEAQSWKPSQGQGICPSPRKVSFYRDLLVRLAGHGRASFDFLKLGDERIAGCLALRLGETVYGAQTAYDLRYKALGPGTFCKSLSVQRAIARGARRYDLLALFAEDKVRWMPTYRPNQRIVVHQVRGPRRRVFAAAARARKAFQASRAPSAGAAAGGVESEV
jgi:hypothetical protein